ncbi:MAG: DNA-3-methyladenine glycosylase family protein, partial [Planctomycetota bacterium]
PYLSALARGPELEPLREDGRPTGEVRARLLELPGFGPYAAENMLRLLGRFEHLALDSWVVRRWKQLFPRSRPTPRAITRRLGRYGRWRGLAMWLLLTRAWYGRVDWRELY